MHGHQFGQVMACVAGLEEVGLGSSGLGWMAMLGFRLGGLVCASALIQFESVGGGAGLRCQVVVTVHQD